MLLMRTKDWNLEAIDFDAVARSAGVAAEQCRAVARLLASGCTVPFIAHYRRQETGGLREAEIFRAARTVDSFNRLESKRETLIRSLAAAGRLTDDVAALICDGASDAAMDDAFGASRPRAIEWCSECDEVRPLADALLDATVAPEEFDRRLEAWSREQEDATPGDELLETIRGIAAERIAADPSAREAARTAYRESARVEGHGPALAFAPKQLVELLLAERRAAEQPASLSLRIEYDQSLVAAAMTDSLGRAVHPLLADAVARAAEQLVAPSLERELLRELRQSAESFLLEEAARDLEACLMQSPLAERRIIAVVAPHGGPGACVATDRDGSVLEAVEIAAGALRRDRAPLRALLRDMLRRHNAKTIAIGGGPGGLEMEQVAAAVLADEGDEELAYCLTADKTAQAIAAQPCRSDEQPELNQAAKVAVSMARRLLDPLSELCHCDPRQLVSDARLRLIEPKRLRARLDEVVQTCVHRVGVDVNRASPQLLQRLAGMSRVNAKRLCDYRDAHGPFRSREAMRRGLGMSDEAFAQVAGFLRVRGGDEPLDETAVHPDDYELARRAAAARGAADKELNPLARQLGVETKRLATLIEQLDAAKRDPRSGESPVLLRRAPISFADLHPGRQLSAVVVNVVDYGAFLDVGVGVHGLVHVSRMGEGYVPSPHDVVSVGQAVQAWVIGVDRRRKRITLSLTPVEAGRREQQPLLAEKKAATRPERRKQRPKPRKPPAKITHEQRSGNAPLRGFDELQALLELKRQASQSS